MPPRMRQKTGRRKDKRSVAPKKRSRHFEDVEEIDFRDQNLLRKFITEHGKIMPARLTGATSKQQRQVARAIRRARVMGFMQ